MLRLKRFNTTLILCFSSLQVDVIVTTAGGIEEDFIKCLAPTYLGDFALPGRNLRENGINRIGNLLVPNDNYCKFESWLSPILDQLLEEQNTKVRHNIVTYKRNTLYIKNVISFIYKKYVVA